MQQREIKFRAWDKAYKAMCYTPDGFKNVSAWLETPEVFVVMQYIDLEDLDGNPIYEGDIWQPYLHNWKNPSKDEPRGAPFVIAYEQLSNCGHCSDDDGIGFNFHGKHYGKVIGNIYENPELLNADTHQPSN